MLSIDTIVLLLNRDRFQLEGTDLYLRMTAAEKLAEQEKLYFDCIREYITVRSESYIPLTEIGMQFPHRFKGTLKSTLLRCPDFEISKTPTAHYVRLVSSSNNEELLIRNYFTIVKSYLADRPSKTATLCGISTKFPKPYSWKSLKETLKMAPGYFALSGPVDNCRVTLI